MNETLEADTAHQPVCAHEVAARLAISKSTVMWRRRSIERPLLDIRGVVARHTVGEPIAAPMALSRRPERWRATSPRLLFASHACPSRAGDQMTAEPHRGGRP